MSFRDSFDPGAGQRAVRAQARKAQEQVVTISGGKVHRLQGAHLKCPKHGAFNAGELRVITDMAGELTSWEADQGDCLLCGETGRFSPDIMRWLRGEGITLPPSRSGGDSAAVATIREQLEQAATIVDEAVTLHDGEHDQVGYALLIGKVFDALREDQ